MQRGALRKQHGSWILSWREEIIKDGQPVIERRSRKLCRVSDEYRTKSDVWPLADDVLRPINRNEVTPEGGITISEFVEKYFLPFIKAKRKPSTEKFYRDAFENHVSARAGHVRLKDFTARHAQEILDASTSLAHGSVLRLKTTMSAIFSHAIRLGFLIGANPVRETRAEGRRTDPDRYAYTLNEVLYMLKKLSEPSRTVVAVAAFSGLRESELRGLQWPDYDSAFIHVRRSVWRTHVGDTKTPESRARVPVIAPLRRALDAHRKRDGKATWIFSGEKMGRPLHLDNLSRRVIKPILKGRWHGWHAFRRGLATNLYELGVPAEVAQLILRHANVSTTREHYLMLESRGKSAAAMRKLERALAKK